MPYIDHSELDPGPFYSNSFFFFTLASFHAGLIAWLITLPNIILVQVQVTSW